MGLRGPQKKPTVLEVLEGRPGHRPLPRGEPRPRELVPSMPDHFDETARGAWSRAIKVMTPVSGWITEADTFALEGLAYWYAEWFACDQVIRTEGRTFLHEQHFIDVNGMPAMNKYPKPRPEVKMRKDAWVEFTKLADRLGLSPAQRARIQLKPHEDAADDDLDPA